MISRAVVSVGALWSSTLIRSKTSASTTSGLGPGTWKGGAATLGCGVQARDFLSEAHKLNPTKIIHTGEYPVSGKGMTVLKDLLIW